MSMTSSLAASRARRRRCIDALAQRILVIDGAMGTMVQSYELDESRLSRRALRATASTACTSPTRDAHAQPRHAISKGNNDLLTLTRPDIIRGDPRRLSRCRRRPRRDQHVQRDRGQPGRLPARSTSCYELNREGARLARAACDAAEAKTPRQAALRHRRARPDQPHGVDQPRRQRSGLPQHELRRAARRPIAKPPKA